MENILQAEWWPIVLTMLSVAIGAFVLYKLDASKRKIVTVVYLIAKGILQIVTGGSPVWSFIFAGVAAITSDGFLKFCWGFDIFCGTISIAFGSVWLAIKGLFTSIFSFLPFVGG